MTCHGVKCPSLHDRLPLWSYPPFLLPEFCLFFSCKVNRTSSATKTSAAPPDLFSKEHLERYLLTAQFCFVSRQVTLTNQPQKLQKWSLLRPLQVIHNLLIKLGSSKKFEVYSCGIYSHREEPVFSCLESAFFISFSGKQQGVMVELAQQLTSVWRSAHHQCHHHHNPLPCRTPLLSSSVQTYEIISHHLGAKIDILLAVYHQLPQASPLPSTMGSAYVDDLMDPLLLEEMEDIPHEVHQPTLFWCSTNWPSTFCVTIQPTTFPVKHHPSRFDFAPPPSQQQPASHRSSSSSSSCSADTIFSFFQ